MKPDFDERIARAGELAETWPGARDLLYFYRELALFQKPIFAELKSRKETSAAALVGYFPGLIDLVRRKGPAPLSGYAAVHLLPTAAQEHLLLTCWEGDDSEEPPEALFLARVLLQPFAESLATRGAVESGGGAKSVCPFCNARPVAGVLRGEGDGGKRWLLCSLCSTEWEFRRIVCPGCGEENKDNLPVYIASEIDYVRVDACDTCRSYLKSVDLTKNGRAVPIVDEIATVALDIWAEEHGYSKLERNILGM
jgi:FdhE protein